MNADIGTFIILGSNNCYYKVDKALELGENKPYINYIVSGGNVHKSGDMTEADYMANYLINKGIKKDKIFIENSAKNTLENFKYSYIIAKNLISNSDKKKIGVITADFHMKRTKYIVKDFYKEFLSDTYFFNAYGPNTNSKIWYKNEIGKKVIYSEISKIIDYEFSEYLKFINS